jgi:hypothetical protein
VVWPEVDAAEVALICQAAMAVGNVVLVLDEADWWAQPTSILPAVERVLKYGRHRGVRAVLVSRRPAEIHRLATSQARVVWVLGPIREPIDLDYLRRFVSVEVAEAVPDLPRYTAIRWDPVEGSTLRVQVSPDGLTEVKQAEVH